jgi:hypothetical protein
MKHEGLLVSVGIKYLGRIFWERGSMKQEGLFCTSRNCITWEAHFGREQHEAESLSVRISLLGKNILGAT